MSKIDVEYHNLLDKILQEGYAYEDPNRKGINRIEIPSYTFRHEFKDGFPAITTKKLHYKNVVTELLWFLKGDTNIKYLVDNGCNIWNKDAYNYYLKKCILEEVEPLNINKFIIEVKNQSKFRKLRSYTFGDLGPIYGRQWRRMKRLVGPGIMNTVTIDQISNLIKSLKEKPLGTEHIVNSWNAAAISEMALPPCHYGFQIVMRPLTIWERSKIHDDLGYKNENLGKFHGMYLDDRNIARYGFELHWNQRSCDLFLGIPYNIASYAILALILEKITGHKALSIQGDLKKVHLYDNSLDAVKEQLSRDVNKYGKCELKIDNNYNWNNFDGVLNVLSPKPENGDFQLENYESYPAINVEMLERDE